ncbi:MAG: Na/Pi symporter, partial [Phycisphaerales bacterium]|nr:Na/Pi symporter [Phycisphaerales bacterium]
MLAFLSALGGVALILFGIRFLRKGLDKIVGLRLSVWVGRLTGGPCRTAAVGIGLGLVSPSSSSQGLLAVSLVRDGLLPPARAILLLMGAYVGATLLLHVVAFDLVEQAPIGLLIGVALFQGTKASMSRGVGQVIVAVSLVLIGVGIVGRLTSGFKDAEDARTLAEIASGYPLLAAALAMAAAAMFQSSTAALAVVIGLALQDGALASSGMTVACVAGANVGLSAIAVVASWSDVPARRFVLVVLLSRALAALAALSFITVVSGWVEALPGGAAQRVAWFHTAFNLAALLVVLPTAGFSHALVERLVKSRPNGNTIEPLAIDVRYADDPGLAFAQTKR